MIVPMRKVTLFISAPHREEALRDLRRLGVVHIQHLKAPISDDVSQLESELNRTEKSLRFLGQELTAQPQKAGPDMASKVEAVLTLVAEEQQLATQLEEKETQISWYKQWGKISQADREMLARHGISIRLYITDKSFLKRRPPEAHIEILDEDKSTLRLALIADSKEQRLELKEIYPPEEDYESLQEEIERLKSRRKAIAEKLQELKRSAPQMLAYREQIGRDLEFARVSSGMETAEEICYLQGYCPEGTVESLGKTADKEGWGLLLEEPAESDNPPTLLKMNAFTRLIKPVFDFLGTVPGYREFDISSYFLFFFSIFVAMIIGDAGYGVIFLVLSGIFHRCSRQKGEPLPLAIKLFYVLSLCTIAWGTITGNWFGSVRIAARPFFKALTIPQLATFPELFPGMEADPQQRVMFICFVIAISQLGLANIMNFINELPGLRGFSHLGWFVIMVGLFFVVLNLVLGLSLPGFTIPLIGIGLATVILFSAQERGKSFLKGVVKGLGGAFTTFLDTISSFSNIISYIRLFAVGMATVAIASSFNQIAAPMLKGFTIPVAVIILLIGHGLNIAMGVLSVIVHGIRLNVLEFSSQLGMEWTGYKYTPFKEKHQDIKEGETR